MPVNLLGVSVLAQQAAQHPQPLHPQQLGGQAGLPGPPPLTCCRHKLSGTPSHDSMQSSQSEQPSQSRPSIPDHLRMPTLGVSRVWMLALSGQAAIAEYLPKEYLVHSASWVLLR